jgi:nucleoside phosphorylase
MTNTFKMPSLTVEDYHIGWVCALPKEMTAALSMLDEEHPILKGQQQHDNNNYALGRIHNHNVVIACMPAGADGLVNAANVARDMARTFPALRVCLMVGIGGGIPNLEKGVDVRLGDIIVSQPDGTWGGVVQYDKGKAESGGKFVLKGQLNQPPLVLLQTLSRLKAEHDRRDSWVSRYMKGAIERNPRMKKTGYIIPMNPDRLYCRECDEDIESLTVDCTANHKVRDKRSDSSPVIQYGIVASANQVVKDATVRDDLRDQFGALCVEMEAAGLMNHFPCLVIRGVCDYADSHKNDAWHPYAAMTAAAYAKEFLYYVSPTQASHEKPIQQVIGK